MSKKIIKNSVLINTLKMFNFQLKKKNKILYLVNLKIKQKIISIVKAIKIYQNLIINNNQYNILKK
jgi:hypothetical protein